MKKILLLLTGGTICSSGDVDNLNRSVNMNKAKTLLVQNFATSNSHHAQQQFETEVVMEVLSENMTIECWSKLLRKLKEINIDDYKGVIVAHGTDTLAYTACFLSLALSGVNVPVFLVSSNLPLDTNDANGNINFRRSVELVCDGITPGTYVVYKNSDDNIYLHLAAHLKQCNTYTDDFFSNDMADITCGNSLPNHKIDKSPIDLDILPTLKNGVIMLKPYVGLDYSSVRLNNDVKIVVHCLYHSQTACTQLSEPSFSTTEFLKQCDNIGVDVILTPRREGKPLYESANALNAISVYGLTAEMTYVKAVVAHTLGFSGEKLSEFMKKNICGEFIC